MIHISLPYCQRLFSCGLALLAALALEAQPCTVTINPAQPVLTCQDTALLLTATTSGGSAPFTFTWNTGVSSATHFIFSPGNYCVTVTDGNGCTASACVNVTQATDIPPAPFPCGAPIYCESPFSSLCGTVNQSNTTAGSCLGYYTQWIQFTADDPFLSLQLDAQGSINPNSYVSAQVFLPGDNCEEVITFTAVTGCFYIDILTGLMNITATNLIPGQTYYLGIGSLQPGMFYTLTGLGFGNPIVSQIIPAYDCAQDSTGGGSPDCSQVCENATMTYTLQPPSFGGFPIWNVSGAESYSFDGNILTVSWGGAGSGSIIYTSPGFCGTSTAYLCVDIVAEAEAVIATQPPAVGNTLTVCRGQSVYFTSQSLNADAVTWDFGDLQTSNDIQPIHVYDQPGTYEVVLVARNSCFCADTASLTIVVQDALTPEVGCQGTVCEGETVTYSTSASCASFIWSVSPNGTVISGGGATDPSISIQWNTGPIGTITLDVGGCSGIFCASPSVTFIPIISENVEIEGPTQVCAQDRATYNIPPYQGAAINWTVTGGGYIAEGQGSSSIEVIWTGSINPAQPHYVIAEINNCYLDCSGRDTLAVWILDEFFTAGPAEICSGDAGSYSAQLAVSNTPVSCHWTLKDPTGIVVWTSGAAASTVNPLFTYGPGRYDLEAVPAAAGTACNSAFQLAIHVIEAPPPVSAISGEDQICPGNWYTYEAAGGLSGNSFRWEVQNGGSTTFQNGNPLNVQWSATGPYQLSVVQINGNGLPCESTPTVLVVNPIPVIAIIGDSDVCKEEQGTYTAPDFEGLDYEWSTVPSDAGTVISGQHTPNVQVFWHSPGNHMVQLDMCGQILQWPVMVRDLPVPAIAGPAQICAGDLAMVQTATPYSSYSWQDATGAVISIFPVVSLSGGDYAVEVTDSHGCEGSVEFSITEYPLPEVFISTPDNLYICNNNPPVHFYANDDAAGLSYQWYKDGSPTWIDSPELINGQYSSFHVEVTDANGCSAVSNALTIVEACGGGGAVCNNPSNPGTSCVNGLDIAFNWSFTPTCETIQFTNTSADFVPGSLNWDFDDPASGAANQSMLPNPTHQYSKAGFYTVVFSGTTSGGDLCWMYAPVEVRAVADFFQEISCAGLPMSFYDRTTYLPTVSLTGWQWDFGDPASGAANFSSAQDPTHVFSTSGTFLVTLTVTTSSGCTSVFSKQVTVVAPPAVAFSPPAQSCEASALSFLAVTSPDGFELAWDFDDPSSGSANTASGSQPFHAFNAPGAYQVMLTATSVYGCSQSHTEIITVVPNTLGGNITALPPPPLCEGFTTVLTAPSGGTDYVWTGGETLSSVIAAEEGVFQVTITNSQGCSYTTPPFPVDIVPAPTGTIRAIEYNEFGQPVFFDYDGIVICEGEDVYLDIVSAGAFVYAWSTGESGTAIEFSEDRGNQLDAGVYQITVNITDLVSGCSQQAGPYSIVVNALPDPFDIIPSPAGIACEGTPVTFSVASPQAGIIYQWNTGETGNSITSSFSGAYSAMAVNAFGCSRGSDSLFIQRPPDIGRIPGGCHTRCEPDTLCLPPMQGIVSLQWLFNGSPIPAPNGIMADLIASQSGSYELVMTDLYGCSATSDPLYLDLYQGYGSLVGEVYFDINNNGVIDAADTLMAGVDIILTEGGIAIDTSATGISGEYGFVNILSTGYILLMDTTSLPNNTAAYFTQVDTALVGCDDLRPVDWLVHFQCTTVDISLPLSVCDGDSLLFNGQIFYPGDSQDFTYALPGGCDSVVHLTVTGIPPANAMLDLSVCDGDSISYLGYVIYPGNAQEITLASALGCDSLLTVQVSALPVNTEFLNLNVCPGETIDYNGQVLSAGANITLILTNQYGCDSTVSVSVISYPEFTFQTTGSVSCWNAAEGVVAITDIAPAGGSYTYSLDDVQYQVTPLFESLAPGIYTVFVSDGNDCVQEQSVTVAESPPIQMAFQQTELPCASTSLTLTPIILSHDPGALTFLWQDSAASISYQVFEPGTYEVAVTSECEVLEQTVTVTAEDDADRSYVFIPNVFSPNFDGINDQFRAFFSAEAAVNDFLLRVYDRWGNMIYETTDPIAGWDGPFREKAMDGAVFAFYIQASIFACHEPIDIFQYGDVTIVR